MRAVLEAYTLDDDPDRINFDRVQQWLATSYWSPGITFERVKKAASGSSLLVGAYDGEGCQTGYLRVVSDLTTFAWICDVIVDEAHQGRGLGKAMVRFALDHPEHRGLRRWLLATRDAHSVYAAHGFALLPNPERWMIYLPDPESAATHSASV